MAIASMATSMGGLFFGGLPGVVGLILGIAALRRIRTNGKQGRGLAITGIVVGSLGVAYLIVVILFIAGMIAGTAQLGSGSYAEDYGSSSDDGWTDEDDTIPSYTLRTDLAAGDCLDAYAYEWDMSDTTVVPCTQAHEGEVLALVTMTAPTTRTMSTEDPAWEAAMDECTARAEDRFQERIDDVEVVLYTPHPDDYASGGTTAYCTFYGYDGQVGGGAAFEQTSAAGGVS